MAPKRKNPASSLLIRRTNSFFFFFSFGVSACLKLGFQSLMSVVFEFHMPDCTVRRRFPRQVVESYRIPYVEHFVKNNASEGDCKIVLDVTQWSSPVSQEPLGKQLQMRYPSCRQQRKAANMALETYFKVCSAYTSRLDPDDTSKYNKYQLWRCYTTLKQSLTAHFMWDDQLFKMDTTAADNANSLSRIAQRRLAFWPQRVVVDEPSIRILLDCLNTPFSEFCWKASKWASVDVDREASRPDGTIMAGVLISILQEVHQNLCFGNREFTLKARGRVSDSSKFWIRGLELMIAFFLSDFRHFNSPGSVVDYGSCVEFFPYLPLPFVSSIAGSFLDGCFAVQNVSSAKFQEIMLTHDKMARYILRHVEFLKVYLPREKLSLFCSANFSNPPQLHHV